MDSVIAAAKPAARRTVRVPPPEITPRVIPRMLTSPSWPPRITSRNQSVPPVWLCGRRARAMTFPGGGLVGARSPAQARPRVVTGWLGTEGSEGVVRPFIGSRYDRSPADEAVFLTLGGAD